MATTFVWFFGTPIGDFADPTNWFLDTSGNIGTSGTAPNGATVEAAMLTVAGSPVALTVTTAVTLTILDILTNGGPAPSLTISGASASLTVSNINLENPVGVRVPATWPTGTGANILFGPPASATVNIGGGATLSLGDTSGTQLTINFLDGNGNMYSNTSPVTFGGVVSGFFGTDALAFPLVPFDLGLGVTASTQYDPSTHLLSVFAPHAIGFPQAPSYFVRMDAGFVGTTNSFAAGDDGTNHLKVDSALGLCFCRGTSIETPVGEVPVERLAIGDLVMTSGRQARPIVWIGMGRVLVPRGRRAASTPVIIRQGALVDGVPNRDLHLSKGHALLLDGALIPVEFLVNHRSILWDDQAQEVELWHVELETHDVLRANAAPAESYRDDGNRWLFANANSGWGLPPREPCAPVLTGGPVVDAVWRRLLDRAGGPLRASTTDDPDLHLLIDGLRLNGEQRPNGGHLFRLANAPAEVRIASRAGVPSELGTVRDPRTLGVALRQVLLWQGTMLRLIDASDASLIRGFHPFEADDGIRWTNGAGYLPAALFDGVTGPCQLELRLGCATRYPLEARVRPAA